jgi:hypothetical protein
MVPGTRLEHNPTAISGPEIVETPREKAYGGSSESVFYKLLTGSRHG